MSEEYLLAPIVKIWLDFLDRIVATRWKKFCIGFFAVRNGGNVQNLNALFVVFRIKNCCTCNNRSFYDH